MPGFPSRDGLWAMEETNFGWVPPELSHILPAQKVHERHPRSDTNAERVHGSGSIRPARGRPGLQGVGDGDNWRRNPQGGRCACCTAEGEIGRASCREGGQKTVVV